MQTAAGVISPAQNHATAPKRAARTLALGLFLFGLLIVSMVIAAGLGPVSIPPITVARAVLAPVAFLHIHTVDSGVATIVWQLRLPRILLEVLVGSALAGAGVAFQTLLRNDLADPYTIGVSSGAAVGASLMILLGWSDALHGLGLPAVCMAAAVLTLILVYSLSRQGRSVDVKSMLLAGVIASAFLGAVQMTILRLAGRNSDEIIAWSMGHLSSVTAWRDDLLLGIFAVIGLSALWTQSSSMNLFSLGEESAQHLGLEVERFKVWMLLAGALLTSASVSVSGIIGFVGLMVPHAARRLLRTPDHRMVLPISLVLGAILVVWADTAARLSLGGDGLPVGVVTAFLGGPFFAYLLRKQRRS